MKKQKFLITNDDGIYARGLRSLIEVASNYGEVVVVAPEHPMSAKSHAITMDTPLVLREIKYSKEAKIYACLGTPSDCVKIAVDYVLKDEPPTMILSGINHGANTNTAVIYSGTMGAAMEGSLYGIPSIGFSITSHHPKADFLTAKSIARRIIEATLENNARENLCLNVNIPYVPLEEIKGIMVCRQSLGYWMEKFEKRTNPNGMEYFWLSGGFNTHEPDAKDNDEWAIANNYVSVVPVQTDFTDHKELKTLKNWKF